jgi:crotonobetainyl-CoA:carnitine CoA-transferase CaiB-like acyl-CoA transferase
MAPRLGEHTAEVLAEIGMDDESAKAIPETSTRPNPL